MPEQPRGVDVVNVDGGRVAEIVASKLGVERLSPRICRRGAGERRVGLLIAVEGIDGAGTTTIARLLVEALSALGLPAVYTKEPTQSPIGGIIRTMLSRGARVEPELITHLFIADRVYHVYEEEVVPGVRGVIGAVAGGYAVVTDRYKYSNAAYQSREADPASSYTIRDILELNSVAPPAHILVYLDVEPSVAYTRIKRRSRLELYENPATLAAVRRAYHMLVKLLAEKAEETVTARWAAKIASHTGLPVDCLYPSRASYPLVAVIDAGRTLEDVALDTVLRVLRVLLDNRLVDAS